MADIVEYVRRFELSWKWVHKQRLSEGTPEEMEGMASLGSSISFKEDILHVRPQWGEENLPWRMHRATRGLQAAENLCRTQFKLARFGYI